MKNIYRIPGDRWRYRFMSDGVMVNGPNVATQEEAGELLRLALEGVFPDVRRKASSCSNCGQAGHYKRTCGRSVQLRQPKCESGDGCDIDEDNPGFCAKLGFCGLVKCWIETCGAKGKWNDEDGCYCRFHYKKGQVMP